MHIIHYLKHLKINSLLIDYYSEEKLGVNKYILKVDWKTIHEGYRLSDQVIRQKVLSSDMYMAEKAKKAKKLKEHLNVLHLSKYNEPKKENSPSVVLPMTL